MIDLRDTERLSSELERHLPSGSDALPSALPDDPRLNAATRLAASSQPVLSIEMRNRMKAKMLAAVPDMPAPREAPVIRPVFRYLAAGGAAAAVVLIGLIGVFTVIGSLQSEPTPTTAAVAHLAATETATGVPPETATDEPTADIPSPTVEPTAERETIIPAVAATETPEPTLEPTASDSPTSTVTPIPTVMVEPTSTELPTDTPTEAAAPTIMPTATPELVALLTIEGEVDEIVGHRVTISGFDIFLAEDHPVLRVLKIRDMVRLSGELIPGRGVLTIAVDEFELANEDAADNVVETGPEGDVWRDAGSCGNPPPSWAVAKGWRARCEGGAEPGSGSSGNGQDNGHGQGNGNNGNNGNGNGSGNGNGQGGGNNGNGNGK